MQEGALRVADVGIGRRASLGSEKAGIILDLTRALSRLASEIHSCKRPGLVLKRSVATSLFSQKV